jgi:hypothetical protein
MLNLRRYLNTGRTLTGTGRVIEASRSHSSQLSPMAIRTIRARLGEGERSFGCRGLLDRSMFKNP